MEIKNKLTVTRGGEEGGQWGKEREESSNMYKGPMGKDKGGVVRIECGNGGGYGGGE